MKSRALSIRFHFNKNLPLDTQELDREFFIIPHKQGKLPAPKLLGPRWSSPAFCQQLTQQIKANYQAQLETSEVYDAPAWSLRLTALTGVSSSFLFVDPNIQTFDLHCEMLKAFGEPLKATQGRVLLDLHLLPLEQQPGVLHAFSFLCTTIGWKPTRFGQGAQKLKNKALQGTTLNLHISCQIPKDSAIKIAQAGHLQGLANNQVRTLAELPTNELTPLKYREKIATFAQDHGLEFSFLDHKQLKRRNAGAFLAVTRADPQSSGGIAVLRYRPAGAKKHSRKRLSLVGKGVCFDTGGYNIKTPAGMLGMHGDMTGSALALALCGYYSQLKVDFEVHAYLALAENLISPTAYKPNEVVIASDGTSIEVVDTDAEGRMVLADTIALARKDQPDLLIDYATLTGAAIKSLDRRKSAVFSHSEELAKSAVLAGTLSGERVWSFPLDADYRRALKSPVADILQCAESNNADHIYAAAFLGHFAGTTTPWVHMDLVSCENKGGLGMIETQTTGFGVLWTDAFVKIFFQ